MLIDISKIKKINFKDYKIDDNHHIQIFNTLEEICKLSLNKNLNFILTGGLGFLFATNKIFRTIQDVDFVVSKKDCIKWIKELYKNEFAIIYPTNLDRFFNEWYPDTKKEFIYSTPSALNHINWLLNKEGKVSTKFKYIPNDCLIEMIIGDYSRDIIYEKKIEKYNIKYRLPYKFLRRNILHRHNYMRQKDVDDIEFYSKFII
jgi:hypothetical protein